MNGESCGGLAGELSIVFQVGKHKHQKTMGLGIERYLHTYAGKYLGQAEPAQATS